MKGNLKRLFDSDHKGNCFLLHRLWVITSENDLHTVNGMQSVLVNDLLRETISLRLLLLTSVNEMTGLNSNHE